MNQQELHDCIKGWFPSSSGNMHIKSSPLWDIGQAVGIAVEVPTEVIDFAHHHIDPFPADKVRGPGAAFGAEADPPADATPSEAFVAWTGRTPLLPR